jgi:hypothetical protein
MTLREVREFIMILLLLILSLLSVPCSPSIDRKCGDQIEARK